VTLLADDNGKSKVSSYIPCCQDKHIIFCKKAKVNPKVLGQPDTIKLPNMTAEFVGNIADNPNAFSYKTTGSDGDLVITCSADKTSCNVHATNEDGVTFTLEHCGNDGHVWKRVDLSNLTDDGEELVPADFVTLLEGTADVDRSSACCRGQFIIFCRKAKTNPQVLGHPGAIKLPHMTADFASNIAKNPNAFSYKTPGLHGDVVITCSADKASCMARATNEDGVTFVLEHCKNEGHVWKRWDLSSLPVDKPEK
jgi:hypothetical protein